LRGFCKLQHFDAYFSRGFTRNSRIYFVKNQGGNAVLIRNNTLKRQHYARKLTARGYFRKRLCVCASVGAYEKLQRVRAVFIKQLFFVFVFLLYRGEEYDLGHIPDAICIPNETISDKQPAELPDLDQVILVYCRSGRRSKDAAQKLFNMGYTNIYEFGGILDWDGEIVEEFDYEENDLDDVEEAATEEEPEDDEDLTTESKGTSNGSAGGKLPSGSGGSSYTTRKKTSTSSTTEFDPDDHDIEGYYEDNRDEFDDIDDAYDAFEDDEDAWDDY